MSELRARKPNNQTNGHNKRANGQSNGHSKSTTKMVLVSPEDEVIMKKKLALLEEDQQQQPKLQETSKQVAPDSTLTTTSDTNNNCNSDNEELFSDTFTMTNNPKADKIHRDDNLVIYNQNNSTSIGHSARDQMAASLLRLQAQLDASSNRLSAIEARVDSLAKSRQTPQQRAAAGSQSGAKGLLNRNNLTSLAYLSWPVLVFFIMRAIERRNALKQVA